MFKNIAKRIQLLAVVMAVFLLISFLALAAFFLVAMLGTNDPDLRAAGLQGIIVSVILALVTPLFSWLIYGFGTLIRSAEQQAEASKETRDMLQRALADGALSDELTRKLGMVIAKAVATAPAPRQVAAKPLAARPVAAPAPAAAPTTQPAAPVPPTAPAAPAAPAAPVEEARPIAAPAAPVAPVPPTAPAAAPVAQAPEAPVKSPVTTTSEPTRPAAIPTDVPSTVQPLKPLGGNKKTF